MTTEIKVMASHLVNETSVESKTILAQQLVPPKQYAVYLLNDDFTPMDFVMYVLQNIFFMDESNAFALMMTVHEQGKGLCGIYSWDIATTKQSQVMDLAFDNEHPLQCTVEEAVV